MYKAKYGRINKLIFIAVIIMMSAILSSCALKKDDETPPTAPFLTLSELKSESVLLSWSESYDNVGINEYKVYRNNSVLTKTKSTQHRDETVTQGEEYEYYVVAYDEAGNRSSKSIKQNIRITFEEPIDPAIVPTPGVPDSELSIQKLAKSTVKLYTLDDDYNVIAMGSGTIVNKSGFILTNFHCVGSSGRLFNSEGYVAVAITDDIKKNIQPQYIAQYRSGEENLDLAVVKIVADLNWNTILAEDLNLVPATLSDSEKVLLGDGINILGYPGVGGETITFTAGHVSGFIDEDGDSEVDWIKTDAVVNHGNSGGTAINKKGEMIGIPTAKILGEDNDIMFYLKPINQAASIIKDALSNSGYPNLPLPDGPEPGKDNPNQANISLYGRIVDSYTLEPVVGGAFVILQQGITIDDFANDPQDRMILSYGETDSDGLFICDYIPNGAIYAVLVVADGYLPILEDYGIEIAADWYDNIDIGDVYLEPEY